MHSIVLGIAVLLGAASLLAYKDGPPPGRTGGLGGETCAACHTGNPLNAPGGELRIAGLPRVYSPGVTYPLTVTLRRADLYVAGFQMASRTGDGKYVGEWRAIDDRTRATGDAIQQTLRGSRVAEPGEGRWHVEWTAPTNTAGAVLFHAAANASNDDASPLGDFVYTTEQRVEP